MVALFAVIAAIATIDILVVVGFVLWVSALIVRDAVVVSVSLVSTRMAGDENSGAAS